MIIDKFGEVIEMFLLPDDRTTSGLKELSSAVEDLKAVIYHTLSKQEKSKESVQTVDVDLDVIAERHGLEGDVSYWFYGIAGQYVKDIQDHMTGLHG